MYVSYHPQMHAPMQDLQATDSHSHHNVYIGHSTVDGVFSLYTQRLLAQITRAAPSPS